MRVDMTATVFSALRGKLVGKHPTLGVLVSEDGMVLMPRGWTKGSSVRKDKKYPGVRIHGHYYLVHRIVAETFIPNPENKPTVDHIDRNTSNNCVLNLRWATHTEQRINSAQCINAKDLGVICRENPKEWARRNARLLYNEYKKDPEWVEKERKRLRDYAEKRKQDPEFKKRNAEKARRYRAKKKAEQAAQPSN